MWFRAITLDLGKVGDALQWFDIESKEAVKEVQMTGNAAALAALLPGFYSYRMSQYYELAAIVDLLEIKLRAERAKKLRHFMEHYNRSLSVNEASKWIDGEDDIVALTSVVNEVVYVRNLFHGYQKALDSKKYMLGNIVALHKSGIADLEI